MNAHIDTLFDRKIGHHSSFLSPSAVTEFQGGTPSVGTLNTQVWENSANVAFYLWNSLR